MTENSGTYVPTDYSDLYEHYIQGTGRSLAQILVRKFVPNENDQTKADLLHDVYVRMVSKDVLKLFDPTKSNFGGVVYFVTRTVCVNYLKRKGRDPITALKVASIEEAPPEEDVWEKGVMYLDRTENGPHPQGALVIAIDAERKIRQLKKDIDADAGVRGRLRAIRLVRLMDLLMEGYSPRECAEKEGVTMGTIYNWLRYMKDLAERDSAD